MAERERFGFDWRAVRLGIGHGTIAGAGSFAFTYAITRIIGPALSDFGWGDRTPGPAALGLVAAGVGLFACLAKVRGSRRVVVAGYTATGRPGARALELARLSAARPDPRAARGAEVASAVRRWTPDLLHGGAPDEVEEVIFNGTGPGADSEPDGGGGAADRGDRRGDRVPSAGSS